MSRTHITYTVIAIILLGILAVIFNPFKAKAPEITIPTAIADLKEITGTVSYREKIALPKDAVIEVTLLEMSATGTPANEIAYSRISNTGTLNVPVAYSLSYDPILISKDSTYGIRAKIIVDGEIKWENKELYPTLVHGLPSDMNDLMLTAK
jgi:putative lipoprotein